MIKNEYETDSLHTAIAFSVMSAALKSTLYIVHITWI